MERGDPSRSPRDDEAIFLEARTNHEVRIPRDDGAILLGVRTQHEVKSYVTMESHTQEARTHHKVGNPT